MIVAINSTPQPHQMALKSGENSPFKDGVSLLFSSSFDRFVI